MLSVYFIVNLLLNAPIFLTQTTCGAILLSISGKVQCLSSSCFQTSLTYCYQLPPLFLVFCIIIQCHSLCCCHLFKLGYTSSSAVFQHISSISSLITFGVHCFLLLLMAYSSRAQPCLRCGASPPAQKLFSMQKKDQCSEVRGLRSASTERNQV